MDRIQRVTYELSQISQVADRYNITRFQAWRDHVDALMEQVEYLNVFAKRLKFLSKPYALMDEVWLLAHTDCTFQCPDYLLTVTRTWNYWEFYVMYNTYLVKSRPDWLLTFLRLHCESFYKNGPLVQENRLTVHRISNHAATLYHHVAAPLTQSSKWKMGESHLLRFCIYALHPTSRRVWLLYCLYPSWPWCLVTLIMSFAEGPPIPSTALQFENQAGPSLYV